jgi:WD40 repeat protein
VLTARQMGKSSLRVQVMGQLQAAGVKCSAIDLTGIGAQNITADQWYRGIMRRILQDLQLLESFDLDRFCQKRPELGWVQRLSEFVEELLLRYVAEPLVVFVDEIDSTISLPFDSDDFFAWIRYCCNLRADLPHYGRLAFCLLGVATPTDLIQDGTRTPFNVGRSIELERFAPEQLRVLLEPLAEWVADLDEVQGVIYEWTGGQPFLTQRLCQMLLGVEIGEGDTAAKIGAVVRDNILTNWEFRDQPAHLQTIRSRLLNKDEQAVGLLSIYQQVLQKVSLVLTAEDLLDVMALRLTGLVVSELGYLVLYNRIYREVFDEGWVEQELAKLRPYAGSLREWLAGGQDDAFLLAGQGLVEAQQWAGGRRLSEVDYQYLTASQRLDTDRVKAEAEQTVAQVKADADKITSKARQTASRWTIAGIGGFVVATMATGWAGYNYNEVIWKTNIEQEMEAINALPVNSLSRLIGSVIMGRKLQTKFHDARFPNYPSYSPTKSLQNVLTAQWHETNTTESKSSVIDMAVSGDGQTIVSAHDDNTVKVWLRNGSLISTLNHQGKVSSVAVSGDGQTVVSGSRDGISQVWLRNGFLISTLNHQGKVSNVAVSGDGQTIVSAHDDNTVKVWLRNGSLISILNHQGKIYGTGNALNPNYQGDINNVAVSTDGKTIVSGSWNTVKVWRQDGSLISTFAGYQGGAKSVAMNADGKTIVSGGYDKAVRVWRQNGSLISTSSNHQDSISGVAISADGQTIVSGDYDGIVKIRRQDGSLFSTLFGHQGSISGVAISADGQTIASSSGHTMKIWQRDGYLTSNLYGHEDKVHSVAVSADGQTIVSGSFDKTVKLWRRDGSLISTLSGHKDKVYSVAVSADGQTIVSGSFDKTVKLWRRDGSLISTLSAPKYVYGVAVSADGQTIVSDGEVWKRDGSHLFFIPGSISSVAVSADGQTIVSGSWEGIAQIWRRDGSLVTTIPDHQGSANSVAVSADGQIIVSKSWNKTVKVWRRNGSLISTLSGHQDSVFSVAISADGQTILSGGKDKAVKVWRRDGSLISTLSGHQDSVYSVAVSADGQTIVSGSKDKAMKVWHFDLDYLLTKGCEQLQEYLSSHPEEDRSQLCPK